ncbi:hypothetical protein RXV90_01980 [Rhodophyticola sp. MJ-SS7]|nr:hypothetical protein [Rhodophyticola sp. MJ-SS7]
MSVTASFNAMTRLRTLRSRRQIASLLRKAGPEGIVLGPCLAHSSGMEVFDARMGDKRLELIRHLRPEAAMLCRGQFDVLEEATKRLGDGTERVTKVAWLHTASGILVTEIPKAPDLPLQIEAGGDERAVALAAAGRWLNSYAAPSAVSDTFGGGYWIRQRSDAAKAVSDFEDRARLEILIETMRKARRQARRRMVTRARCHGDFRPSRLWHEKSVVWAGGLRPDGWGAVLRDVARFLVDLALTAPHFCSASDKIMGLHDLDIASLLGELTLVDQCEIDELLTYFLAVEYSGRLLVAKPQDALLRAVIDQSIR